MKYRIKTVLTEAGTEKILVQRKGGLWWATVQDWFWDSCCDKDFLTVENAKKYIDDEILNEKKQQIKSVSYEDYP